MERPPPLRSSADSLRLSLFGAFALTPGPFPFGSALPSSSSNGRFELVFEAGFGSLDGWVGYTPVLKYGWWRACVRGS